MGTDIEALSEIIDNGYDRPAPLEWFGEDRLVIDLAKERLTGHYRWAKALGWLGWDGQVWAEVDDEALVELARDWTLEHVASIVALRKRREIHNTWHVGWSRVSMKRATLVNLITLARGLEGIHTPAERFDADPDILNTPSGIVDLRTGAVRPCDPGALCTRITRGAYRLGAEQNHDWHKALLAFGDWSKIQWYQRCLGQAVTGHVAELMMVLQGGGENGKGALGTEGVLPALGSYATLADWNLLKVAATKDGARGHSEEIADLKGRRLVVVEELTEGATVNVNTVKRLVSTGKVKASRKYGHTMEFDNQVSLIATTNPLPDVRETDHATWRRLAMVTLPYTFRKTQAEVTGPDDRLGDPELKLRIKAGLQGQHDAIVTWAVQGAMEWYRAPGAAVTLPAAVQADTDRWRQRADRVFRLWHELLRPDPNGWISAEDLKIAFNGWLFDNGHRDWSYEALAAKFSEHTLTKQYGVVHRKIRLRSRQTGELTDWAGRQSQRNVTGFPNVPGATKETTWAWVGARFVRPDDEWAEGDVEQFIAGQLTN